jgi:hypothetical protein
MRRPWLLAALGIAAFLLILAATLPASLLLRFAPPGVAASGFAGSVWKGSAQSIAYRGRPLGALAWNCQVLRLLTGRIACRLTLERTDGRAALLATGGFGGLLELSDVSASLPVSAFGGIVAPPGWDGALEIGVRHAVLQDGWPVSIDGIAVVRSLRAPGSRGVDIGSFELTLGEGKVGTDALSGRLRDLGGPLRVRGSLSLKPDRTYLLEGEVAPGPGADERIFRTLSFLGTPDAAGRRPFAIEGSL